MPAVTTAAKMLIYATEREIAWVFLVRMATLQAIYRHEVRVHATGVANQAVPAINFPWSKRTGSRRKMSTINLASCPHGVWGGLSFLSLFRFQFASIVLQNHYENEWAKETSGGGSSQ